MNANEKAYIVIIFALIVMFSVYFYSREFSSKEEAFIPTYYDCLQLGSDNARMKCLNEYGHLANP